MLIDGDLNPKISDFGLARLDEAEKSHISTRIAGTMLVNASLTYQILLLHSIHLGSNITRVSC